MASIRPLERWLSPILDFRRAIRALRGYGWYIRSWRQYSKMPGAERLAWRDAYPCLNDRTSVTGIDPHYFYQGVWAMQKIRLSGEKEHVDVGSLLSFLGLLSTLVKVIFIDIRPAPVVLENFENRAGTILALPFADDSVRSLSCLHVAEHIGLGRYGDPLDPEGTRKAALELARILSPGGNLYFSLPVGRPRVQFNAHRIHSPHQILDYFADLKLVEFSAVMDDGKFRRNVRPEEMENSTYACGMFHFTKER